jgi:hypothetical protein
MLEQPKVTFKVERTILLTSQLERPGAATLKVPIVPLCRIIDN